MKYTDDSTLKKHLCDSSRKLADLTAAMVYENPEIMDSLFSVTYNDEEPWSLRASRVIAICAINCPELIRKYIPEIINRLHTLKSESARRNLLQIFKEADIKLKSREKSRMLDLCFAFLEGNHSIGLKAYSADIIVRLSNDHPDILHELYTVLTTQTDESSHASQVRTQKMIEKIGKINR